MQLLFESFFLEFQQRKCAERVEKLKNIQSKISISQAKKDPVRQAKLAYVAGPPKPSAQIRRKQIRYGTGEEATGPGERQKPVRKELDNKHKNEAEHTIPFIKIPKRERCSTEPPKRVARPDILSKKPGRIIILLSLYANNVVFFNLEPCYFFLSKGSFICESVFVMFGDIFKEPFPINEHDRRNESWN